LLRRQNLTAPFPYTWADKRRITKPPETAKRRRPTAARSGLRRKYGRIRAAPSGALSSQIARRIRPLRSLPEGEGGDGVRHARVINAVDRGMGTGRRDDDKHHAEQHRPHGHPIRAKPRPLVSPLAPALGATGATAGALTRYVTLGTLPTDRHGAATGNPVAPDPRWGETTIWRRAGAVCHTLAMEGFVSGHGSATLPTVPDAIAGRRAMIPLRALFLTGDPGHERRHVLRILSHHDGGRHRPVPQTGLRRVRRLWIL
jgi:hypothetical protein